MDMKKCRKQVYALEAILVYYINISYNYFVGIVATLPHPRKRIKMYSYEAVVVSCSVLGYCTCY